jgi:hypothetical protein
MSTKDLSDLYEAYRNVYDESIDEAKEDENLSRAEKVNKRDERLGMRSTERKREHKYARGERGNYGIHGDRYEPTKGHKEWNKGKYPSVKIRGRGFEESYDHFDLVLEYLLDEGFCESQENAEAMMAHMSEEWVESIIDEAKCDTGLSDNEKETKRKERGNGGPTSHSLRQGKKTRGNMNHKYEPGKYQK